MSSGADQRTLLAGAVRRAAGDADARRMEGAFDRALWDDLVAIGVPTLGLPEDLGGEGGLLADVVAAVEAAHRYPGAGPIADVAIVTAAAHRRLALASQDGIAIVVAGGDSRLTAGARITGSVVEVPYARYADRLIVLASSDSGIVGWAVVDRDAVEIIEQHSLADEPRDSVRFDDLPATVSQDAADALIEHRSWGALARATQICGALASVLELTVAYGKTREQFGQPLTSFQAIQHHLAAMAGEAVSAKASVDLAVQLIDHDPSTLEIAAAVAKTRCGLAASEVARLAHQVHGALGFTREHDLQRFTRRLWSWRDEFGTEREWGERLGRLVPGERLWHTMTSVP